MGKITVTITDEQRDYLDKIGFEDAGMNLSESVQWCIDSCMKIEENYVDKDGCRELDACYIAFFDIRKEGHPEFKKK